MENNIVRGLTPQEKAFFVALTDMDDIELFMSNIATIRAKDSAPVDHHVARIILDRVSYFYDSQESYPRNEDELGEHATNAKRILGAVAEVDESQEPRVGVLGLACGMQQHYFWGDADSVSTDDIDALFEKLTAMDASKTEPELVAFIYWNILEPWMQFIDEGGNPSDDYKQWSVTAEKISAME